MTAIGKGDFLIAIRDQGIEGQIWIRAGQLCQVGELYPNADTCPDCGDTAGPGFDVVGLRHPEECWCACGFKPAGGQPGMFNELLKAPTDAPTREPVAA